MTDKPLLILDLDETLIHATIKPLAYPADFQVFKYHVYLRPYLHKFLHGVATHYQLAIWSSATDDYVHQIVQLVIPATIPLQFVWGRSKCTYKLNPQMNEFGYYADDYGSHYHYIKALKKVKRLGYNLKQVLIVDDTPRKVVNSYGNAIYPNEFIGQKDDKTLLKLLDYLITLAPHQNYRKIEKRNWMKKN